MARKIIHQLIDDIDGSELVDAGETVTFGLDGVTYEIDLSDENALALRAAIARYVEAGRRTSQTKPTHVRRRISTRNLDAVRAWAREHGHAISDRGRISAAIQAAYNAR